MIINEFYSASYNDVLNAFVKDETGRYTITRPLTEPEILAAAKLMIAKQFNSKKHSINNCTAAKEFLIPHFAKYEYEVFAVLFLNIKQQVIACDDLFKGSIGSAPVYPREVIKCALKHNARSVIIAHNHPSGNPEPSPSDIELTQQLKTALELVEVTLLDHIVVGGANTVSFIERGLL